MENIAKKYLFRRKIKFPMENISVLSFIKEFRCLFRQSHRFRQIQAESGRVKLSQTESGKIRQNQTDSVVQVVQAIDEQKHAEHTKKQTEHMQEIIAHAERQCAASRLRHR